MEIKEKLISMYRNVPFSHQAEKYLKAGGHVYVYAKKGDDVSFHISGIFEPAGWYAEVTPYEYRYVLSLLNSIIPGFGTCIEFTQPSAGLVVSVYDQDGNPWGYSKNPPTVGSQNNPVATWTTSKARYSFLTLSQKKLFSKAVKKLHQGRRNTGSCASVPGLGSRMCLWWISIKILRGNTPIPDPPEQFKIRGIF